MSKVEEDFKFYCDIRQPFAKLKSVPPKHARKKSNKVEKEALLKLGDILEERKITPEKLTEMTDVDKDGFCQGIHVAHVFDSFK